MNTINGRRTVVKVGDQYNHYDLGKGIVSWINENKNAKFPIKIHFKDKKCYAYFNVFGMQHECQGMPLIDFPKPYKNVQGHNKWDLRFLKLAEHIASWSKDPSTKVGAVIVDAKHRIISVGFNGYPKGLADNDLDDREIKYKKVIHAEQNALAFCNCDVSSFTMYVSYCPCSQCASMMIQRGIKRVVVNTPTKDYLSRWEKDVKLTTEMFKEAGMSLVYI